MLTIKLLKAKKKENSFDVNTDIKNRASEHFYNKLKSDIHDFKCNIHPNKESIITITSTQNGKYSFSIKKEFCCEEFEKSIKILRDE